MYNRNAIAWDEFTIWPRYIQDKTRRTHEAKDDSILRRLSNVINQNIILGLDSGMSVLPFIMKIRHIVRLKMMASGAGGSVGKILVYTNAKSRDLRLSYFPSFDVFLMLHAST